MALHLVATILSALTAPLRPTRSIDEAAFLDLVTAASVDDAADTFRRHGIVRIPEFLSAGEASALVAAAGECGMQRDAYGQASQADRYTLWLAGDGMEGSAGAAAATTGVQQAAPCARRAFLDESGWRTIASSCGYSRLALAEVVTSLPGGSAQRWHFEYGGVA